MASELDFEALVFEEMQAEDWINKELVPLRRRTAPEQQFAVLDDYSREAFSRIYPEATTRAATDLLLAALR